MPIPFGDSARSRPTRIKALVGTGGVGYATSEEMGEIVARRVPEFREHGWEKLIARFTERELDGVPAWMQDRIRATDIRQFIDWLLAWPDWKWSEWESLPHVVAPALHVVGELEDPEDDTGKGAGLMPNGTRLRVSGQGHINAFIKSRLVLPDVAAFLAEYAQLQVERCQADAGP